MTPVRSYWYGTSPSPSPTRYAYGPELLKTSSPESWLSQTKPVLLFSSGTYSAVCQGMPVHASSSENILPGHKAKLSRHGTGRKEKAHRGYDFPSHDKGHRRQRPKETMTTSGREGIHRCKSSHATSSPESPYSRNYFTQRRSPAKLNLGQGKRTLTTPASPGSSKWRSRRLIW